MRKQLRLFLPAVLIGLLGATDAPALTTSHITSDAVLHTIMPPEAIAFIAEGRIGDRGGAATFELDLAQSTAAPGSNTAQYGWVSTQVEPFTLAFDNILYRVTFTLGGRTLQYTPGPGFTDIFVRTAAYQPNSSVVVNSLVLDGVGVGDISSATEANALDILRIEGGTLTDGFVLTGNATLTFDANPLIKNSALAFQIKVGAANPPLPVRASTWSAIKALY